MVISSIGLILTSLFLTSDYGTTNISNSYDFNKSLQNPNVLKCSFSIDEIDSSLDYCVYGSYTDTEGTETITKEQGFAEISFHLNSDNDLYITYRSFGGYWNIGYYFSAQIASDLGGSTKHWSNWFYLYDENTLDNYGYLTINDTPSDFAFNDSDCWVDFEFYFSILEPSVYSSLYDGEGQSQTGYTDGYNDGKVAGYSEGFNEGESKGYKNGYDYGYQVGLNVSSDSYGFLNLFGAIADTPVMMIRRMFDFSLFGTSMVIVVLSILSLLILIKLVKKVIK